MNIKKNELQTTTSLIKEIIQENSVQENEFNLVGSTETIEAEADSNSYHQYFKDKSSTVKGKASGSQGLKTNQYPINGNKAMTSKEKKEKNDEEDLPSNQRGGRVKMYIPSVFRSQHEPRRYSCDMEIAAENCFDIINVNDFNAKWDVRNADNFTFFPVLLEPLEKSVGVGEININNEDYEKEFVYGQGQGSNSNAKVNTERCFEIEDISEEVMNKINENKKKLIHGNNYNTNETTIDRYHNYGGDNNNNNKLRASKPGNSHKTQLDIALDKEVDQKNNMDDLQSVNISTGITPQLKKEVGVGDHDWYSNLNDNNNNKTLTYDGMYTDGYNTWTSQDNAYCATKSTFNKSSNNYNCQRFNNQGNASINWGRRRVYLLNTSPNEKVIKKISLHKLKENKFNSSIHYSNRDRSNNTLTERRYLNCSMKDEGGLNSRKRWDNSWSISNTRKSNDKSLIRFLTESKGNVSGGKWNEKSTFQKYSSIYNKLSNQC